VSHAPPLLSSNQFSILEITEPKIDEDAQEPDTPALPPTEPRKPCQPKWEKQIKHKLVISVLSSYIDAKCIMLLIHLKTMDTMEETSTEAMVDTGATGDFIDQDFVTQVKLPTCKLSQPIPVYNVDGTLNDAGSIREVVNVIMTYDQHSEHILLVVTCLGKQSMILGFTWLDKHNPEIDFRARSVKMTRCLPRCCVGYQADRKAEQNTKREDTEWINTCQTGPFPAFIEDADEEDEAKPTPEQSPDLGGDFPHEPLEEGNQIWATGLFPQAEHIHVTAMVSQWLVEGFWQKSQPADHEKHIPLHLRDFHSVFSKDSFDELPRTKPWDHAVELTPDATLKSCKVYPLSASKQKELAAFLKENL